jgi:hypothetical protein
MYAVEDFLWSGDSWRDIHLCGRVFLDAAMVIAL